jgi:hypothetical protein
MIFMVFHGQSQPMSFGDGGSTFECFSAASFKFAEHGERVEKLIAAAGNDGRTSDRSSAGYGRLYFGFKPVVVLEFQRELDYGFDEHLVPFDFRADSTGYLGGQNAQVDLHSSCPQRATVFQEL